MSELTSEEMLVTGQMVAWVTRQGRAACGLSSIHRVGVYVFDAHAPRGELMATSLWTLSMILEFLGAEFLRALADLHLIIANLQLGVGENGSDDEQKKAEDEMRDMVGSVFPRLTVACAENKLKVSLALIEQTERGLEIRYDREALEASCWHIREAIIQELGDHKFARVPSVKAHWFGQDQLFGEQVAKVFPDAAADIQDAGNCLALGLDTAAVFHLMRVAECGARYIGRSVGLRNLAGKKPVPIEYATWGKIAEKIASKIADLHKKNPSAERAKRLTHRSEMNAHILAFKDAWRDDVMHSRGPYDEHQAASILVHVRGFMQRLSLGVP